MHLDPDARSTAADALVLPYLNMRTTNLPSDEEGTFLEEEYPDDLEQTLRSEDRQNLQSLRGKNRAFRVLTN